jgi:ABC-type multidrug transport system fused ATPase/permease subunit
MVASGLSGERYDRTYRAQELVRRVWRYLSRQRRRLAGVIVLILLRSLLGAAGPLLMTKSIDAALAARSFHPIVWLAVGILAVGLLGWGAEYLYQSLSSLATAAVVEELRRDAFGAAIDQDMSFYDQNTTAEVASRVTSDAYDVGHVLSLAANLCSETAVVLVLWGILFVIEWRLALLIVVLVPVIVGFALGLRALARPAAVREMRMRATVRAAVSEAVAGIAVAKAFGQEATLRAQFSRVNELAYRVDLKRGLVLESTFPALVALEALVTTVITYASGRSVIQGIASAGTWYLFVQALQLFVRPFVDLAAFWGRLQDGLSAAERVLSLIDAEPHVTQIDDQPVGRLEGRIAFDGVCFSYRPGAEVLHDFRLAIPAGETLAFVGHTGAGKSSLARLIARTYEFQEGQILIDGQDIRTYDLAAYRRQVGLVPQSPYHFSGSVLDDIRYGLPEASEEQVLHAARRIGSGDWLEDLPDGLRTDVGERGAKLSMGQRQLVALARVLIQDPAILVLDEATASVDPFTEAQIQEGLEEVFRDRTSIVIAHRLSTVVNADRIVVLEEGQIIEEGTHHALLEAGGRYAELYNTYFRHQELGDA